MAFKKRNLFKPDETLKLSRSGVEPTLLDIYKALQSNSIPKKNDECDTCSYVETRFEISTNKK